MQGESSKNALVHFYCRTIVYCSLHNSKRLKISYDWRGMPIEFTQYPSPENTGVSGDTLFRLTVAYDGTGRRISKTRWVKAQGDAGWSRRHVTHYTGIGTEVRENFGLCRGLIKRSPRRPFSVICLCWRLARRGCCRARRLRRAACRPCRRARFRPRSRSCWRWTSWFREAR